MTEKDIVISEACQEWVEDGIISTTTYIALGQAGVDADNLIEFFEENE